MAAGEGEGAARELLGPLQPLAVAAPAQPLARSGAIRHDGGRSCLLLWKLRGLAPRCWCSQVSHFVLYQGSDLLQAAGQLHLLAHGVLLQGADDLVVIPVDVQIEFLQGFQTVRS